MKIFTSFLSICLLILILSCGHSKQSSIKVIYQFSKSNISITSFCYSKDTNWTEIQDFSNDLLNKYQLGFIYFYDDTTKIKKVNDLPDDRIGYFFEAIKRPNENIQFTKVTENYHHIEQTGDTSKLKIVLLKKVEKKCMNNRAVCRWYIYYVENYFNNNYVYEKIKQLARTLPVDDPKDKRANKDKFGFTNVYFFSSKDSIPQMDETGSFGAKTSSNSLQKQYGKYIILQVSMGSGENFYMSKGF